MLTLNAEPHLKETLNRWYSEAPIKRLLVIDGNSNDATLSILSKYPRIKYWIKSKMTTGKAFELLKDLVLTPWFIWIDVGKIPQIGWYDEMIQHKNEGDLLGSKRINYKDGVYSVDPIIADPSKRLLGGPWLIKTEALKPYHVDDDYAQRNIDIIIRRQLEENGGRYCLVETACHKCYLPTPVTDKEILYQRHIQNAKGIVKYITPEYAQKNASYLLNDHWMLMMNKLDEQWISDTNISWIPILKNWRKRRLLIAKIKHIMGRIRNVF